ncbi:hypothetical protein D3C72_2429660 [compost metagenome]
MEAVGLSLSAVAATVTANYQTCNQNGEQLRALQVWDREIRAMEQPPTPNP